MSREHATIKIRRAGESKRPQVPLERDVEIVGGAGRAVAKSAVGRRQFLASMRERTL